MPPTLTLRIPFTLLTRKDLIPAADNPTTKLLTTLSSAFTKLCPQVPVHLHLTPYAPPRDAAALWHLCPSPEPTLTLDERAKVPEGAWSSHMVLVRPGISLDIRNNAWRAFTHEVNSLTNVLRTLHTRRGPTRRGARENVRWYALTPPSLHFCLTSSSSSLSSTLVENIYTVFTALERELIFLAPPANLLRYAPLSRVLECLALRRLAREKRGMWESLKGKGEWSARRREDVYTRKTKRWIAGFDDDEEWLRGRGREWFDVLGGIGVGKVLDFAKNRRICIQPVFDDAGNVQALEFPAFRSEIKAEDILAYTELVTSLLCLANELSMGEMVAWVEKFRERVSPDTPTPTTFPDPEPDQTNGFTHLLALLHISPSSRSYFNTYIAQLYPPTSTTANPPTTNLDEDIFAPLLTHIHAHASFQKAHIPTYISRYTAAGGFMPTPAKKLYALMIAGEHAQRKTRSFAGGRGAKGKEVQRKKEVEWMSSVKDTVRIGDAVELEGEGEGGKARKTPARELSNEEIERWRYSPGVVR